MLVLGNGIVGPKQTTIPIKDLGYLGVVTEQYPRNIESSQSGSIDMHNGNSKKTWIRLLMLWGMMALMRPFRPLFGGNSGFEQAWSGFYQLYA